MGALTLLCENQTAVSEIFNVSLYVISGTRQWRALRRQRPEVPDVFKGIVVFLLVRAAAAKLEYCVSRRMHNFGSNLQHF